MTRGNLFIVSGPSGSGKDTVLSEVFKKRTDLFFSISSVTRPMRNDESEDGKYNFITRDCFEKMIANDDLLEYNLFLGNYYGTPKAPVVNHLNEGVDAVVEVDVNGAQKIREKMPDSVSIFIMPPSLEVLGNRLSGRGTEAAEIVQKRIGAALTEIARAKEYDYIVVNDKLEDAVNDVLSIFRTAKLKSDLQEHLINEVLG